MPPMHIEGKKGEKGCLFNVCSSIWVRKGLEIFLLSHPPSPHLMHLLSKTILKRAPVGSCSSCLFILEGKCTFCVPGFLFHSHDFDLKKYLLSVALLEQSLLPSSLGKVHYRNVLKG